MRIGAFASGCVAVGEPHSYERLPGCCRLLCKIGLPLQHTCTSADPHCNPLPPSMPGSPLIPAYLLHLLSFVLSGSVVSQRTEIQDDDHVLTSIVILLGTPALSIKRAASLGCKT